MSYGARVKPTVPALKPKKIIPDRLPKRKNLINEALFWGIFCASFGTNFYNVFLQFGPALDARLRASGFLTSILGLERFALLDCASRVLAVFFGYLLYREYKREKRREIIYWPAIMLCGYAVFTGLGVTLTTSPFIIAAIIVLGIQYLEIMAWDNPRGTTAFIWILVFGGYGIEFFLQYDMLPFHRDYMTAIGFLLGIMSADFDVTGFLVLQAFFGIVIGMLGVELANTLRKAIYKVG